MWEKPKSSQEKKSWTKMKENVMLRPKWTKRPSQFKNTSRFIQTFTRPQNWKKRRANIFIPMIVRTDNTNNKMERDISNYWSSSTWFVGKQETPFSEWDEIGSTWRWDRKYFSTPSKHERLEIGSKAFISLTPVPIPFFSVLHETNSMDLASIYFKEIKNVSLDLLYDCVLTYQFQSI